MPEFIPSHAPGGVDLMLRGYLAAAEWTFCDVVDGEDVDTVPDDCEGWHPSAIDKARADCEAFAAANAADLAAYAETRRIRGDYSADGCAGHDFWLTRCGHGTGFWDRGEVPADARDRLAKAARRFGNVDVYLGDDKFLYFG